MKSIFARSFAGQLEKEADLADYIVASLGVYGGAKAMSKIRPNLAPAATEGEVLDVARKMKVAPSRISISPRNIESFGVAVGSPGGEGTVYLKPSGSLGTAAHEMGHAQQARRAARLLGDQMGLRAWGSTKRQAQLGSYVPFLMMGSDQDENIGIVGAALHAPQVAQEGGASLRALKNIAAHRGVSRALREAPGLAAAFATYALPAAMPYLAGKMLSNDESILFGKKKSKQE